MSDAWKQIDAALRIEPGKKAKLKDRDPADNVGFNDRADGETVTAENAVAINDLQDVLWAERTRALLVVLQGIDTSGKDGTVRGVFNACGPLGVSVTAFGKPSEEELAHDYLWRVHAATPKKGMIGVFNRSHYEDVLVGKVRNLAPAEAIEQRYDQINAFEKHLTENGVVILKFMLQHFQRRAGRAVAGTARRAERNAGNSILAIWKTANYGMRIRALMKRR